MSTRSPRPASGRPRTAAQRGTAQQGRIRPRRPLPKDAPLYTPGASSARQSLETRSARPLLLLHQLPTWLTPLVAAALLVGGLALPGPGGAAALVALAAVLGWLASVSWSAISAQGRLLRAAAVIGVLVLAVVQGLR